MPTPRWRRSASNHGLRGLSERRSGGVSVTMGLSRGSAESSAQLADLQPVDLRPLLHRLLAAGQCLGDGFERHALARQRAKLGDFLALPRLAVADEMLGHQSLARSEEHTSELQSLMRISYAVFCLK